MEKTQLTHDKRLLCCIYDEERDQVTKMQNGRSAYKYNEQSSESLREPQLEQERAVYIFMLGYSGCLLGNIFFRQ